MVSINLTPVTQDLKDMVHKLTQASHAILSNNPTEDVRRLEAASLANLNNGDVSLNQVVQDCTNNFTSKETGFIAWVYLMH